MWSLLVLTTAGFATINNCACSVMEDISILRTILAQLAVQGTLSFTCLRETQAIILPNHACCNVQLNFIPLKTAKVISASNVVVTA